MEIEIQVSRQTGSENDSESQEAEDPKQILLSDCFRMLNKTSGLEFCKNTVSVIHERWFTVQICERESPRGTPEPTLPEVVITLLYQAQNETTENESVDISHSCHYSTYTTAKEENLEAAIQF